MAYAHSYAQTMIQPTESPVAENLNIEAIDQNKKPRQMTTADLQNWALSQGFFMVIPTEMKFTQGHIVFAPGARMKIPMGVNEKGDRTHTGYVLKLFLGNLRAAPRSQVLASHYGFYENILRFEVLLEGISYGFYNLGYGVSLPEPIEIPIPYLRNIDGDVSVEVRLANHPSNFIVWFGSALIRKD